MAVTKAEFDAVADAWLDAQAGYRQYLEATENLYSVFAEGWRGPRRALKEAFDDYREALLRGSGGSLPEVSEVYPSSC